MNKIFSHETNDLDGLFNYFRNNNLNSSFRIKGPKPYVGEYCYRGTFAADVDGIVDGNVFSAWANIEGTIPTMYFIIDLKKYQFLLNGISVHTPCNHANNLIVLGSNNGNVYKPIVNISKPVDEKTVFYDFSLKPAYRYFKFTQDYIEANHAYHRLHISEVEFFGVLITAISKNTCTYKKTSNIFILIDILLYSIR